MKGIIDVPMWIPLSLVLAFISIGMIIYMFTASVSGSLCWANAGLQINSIQSAFHDLTVGGQSQVFVTFESCIDGVTFINREDFYSVFGDDKGNGLSDSFSCVKNYNGLLIAVPRIKEAPGFLGVVKDFALYDTEETRENARRWLDSFIRGESGLKEKPICKNLPKKDSKFDRISVNEIPLHGGNFCVTIRRLDQSKYTVLNFESVKSKEQCKPPEI